MATAPLASTVFAADMHDYSCMWMACFICILFSNHSLAVSDEMYEQERAPTFMYKTTTLAVHSIERRSTCLGEYRLHRTIRYSPLLPDGRITVDMSFLDIATSVDRQGNGSATRGKLDTDYYLIKLPTFRSFQYLFNSFSHMQSC